MLDQFKVPDDIAVRVAPDDMHATIFNLFAAIGMPEADAARTADVLVYADVRGIDSHGASNMPRRYVTWLQRGQVNLKPEPRAVRDTGPVVTFDGDKGLGLVVAPPAMDAAIERAGRHGVGVAVMSNAAHYGPAAYYAHRALPHDMVGISMTTGGVLVAPTGGAERLLGLNPIGIAAPSRIEVPFIFDASMSSLAANKIALLGRLGGKVLPGWVTRADGSPVMEEIPAPEGFMMLPLGGTREIGSHKGFGLIMLVEVLTSLLGGAGGGPFRRGELRPLLPRVRRRGVHRPRAVQDRHGRLPAPPSGLHAGTRRSAGRLPGHRGGRSRNRPPGAWHPLPPGRRRLVPQRLRRRGRDAPALG